MEQQSEITLNLGLYPKQLEALNSQANEILFGGATRGGKSHFVRVYLILCCLEVPGLQCVILRKVMDDVIHNHMEGPSSFPAMLKPLIDCKRATCTKTQVVIKHEDGPDSTITLGHCGSEDAVLKAQGIPKDILVFEEACQILERHIRFIRAWVTTNKEIMETLPERLRGCMPKIIYTANPIGASVGYFRRNFVKPAPKGTIFRAPDEDGGFNRVYIEAKVEDNASEDTEAAKRRVKGMGDSGYYGALIEANWDSPIGDFFKQYDDNKHCVPDFEIPTAWQQGSFLTFDWGSSEPFAVAWWCVSDGREHKQGLKTIWFPRGALICYREWYGCDPNNTAKGLELPNTEIAKGIIERTHENTSGLVLTDSLPFQGRGNYKNGREYRIADEFEEAGVPLVRANTQRVYGWKQVRDRLIGKDGRPMIYFTQSCKYMRDYLPMLGYNKNNSEDAEESGEATHCSDIIRYACTTKPLVYDEATPGQQQPRDRSATAGSIAQRIIKRNKYHGR